MERVKGIEASSPDSQTTENTAVSHVPTAGYIQIRAQIPDISSPGLAQVVKAWEKLPAALQSAILAIVDSATK
jgi:hypothetical protein